MAYRVLGKRILAGLPIILLVTIYVSAQTAGTPKPILVNGDSDDDSKSHLDFLAHSAGSSKLIIMIARSGKRESAKSVNRRRLLAARSHLEIVRALPRQRIIIAQGESAVGQGRIEVYLEGRLFMVFLFGKNRSFTLAMNQNLELRNPNGGAHSQTLERTNGLSTAW